MKTAVRLSVAGAIVLVATVPWVVAWSSLPHPMASHWTFSSTPDASGAPALLVVLLAGLAVLFASLGAGLARTPGAVVRIGAVGPGLTFGGATIAFVSLSVVLANHDVAYWRDARLSQWWIAAALAVGAGAAALTSWTAPRTSEAAAAARPTTAVGRSEQVAWVGHARSRSELVLVVALVAFGVALMAAASLPAGLVVILSSLVVVAFSSVQVFVGAGGVRLRGPLGLPRMAIGLGTVVSAEVIDVNPMAWGGWGYRGSLGLFKRAAWVVRRGEGLKLSLRDGKVFVVTVDGAREAAAVINGLKAARA